MSGCALEMNRALQTLPDAPFNIRIKFASADRASHRFPVLRVTEEPQARRDSSGEGSRNLKTVAVDLSVGIEQAGLCEFLVTHRNEATAGTGRWRLRTNPQLPQLLPRSAVAVRDRLLGGRNRNGGDYRLADQQVIALGQRHTHTPRCPSTVEVCCTHPYSDRTPEFSRGGISIQPRRNKCNWETCYLRVCCMP